ncbi:MAG: response regulator, partial [Gammaproteobacteria bacterium]
MRASQILVVDDEADIRGMVQEILTEEGYEVRVAGNAAEARSARKKSEPDLVLLDIWMPDMDGISLLKEWTREDSLSFPVVMMSGHGTVETAIEATKLGALDFVEKPLSLAKLLRTVEHAIEVGRQARSQLVKRGPQAPLEPLGKSRPM